MVYVNGQFVKASEPVVQRLALSVPDPSEALPFDAVWDSSEFDCQHDPEFYEARPVIVIQCEKIG